MHCFSCKEGYRLLLSLLQILNPGALCQGEVKKIVENNDEAGPVGVNSPTHSLPTSCSSAGGSGGSQNCSVVEARGSRQVAVEGRIF